MEDLVIRGGTRLAGRVTISGSKNASFPMMAASILSDGPLSLHGVPNIADVEVMREMLSVLGVQSVRHSGGVTLTVTDQDAFSVSECNATPIRGTLCVLGPLLARRGRFRIPLPGGCQIGKRPIDLNLMGLRALGARAEVRGGYVEGSATRLRGATVYLGGPRGSTVTGTCNVLGAAVLAHGRTNIIDAAREPEVVHFGNMLIEMGAQIRGLGTSQLVVDGVQSLAGVAFPVMPDRIETATILIATAITGGAVEVAGAAVNCLGAVIDYLRLIGVDIEQCQESLFVCRRTQLRGMDVVITPYPGIPTDVQPMLCSLLCFARGANRVVDHVFPDRDSHIQELRRFGASIRVCQGATAVQDASRMFGATVNGTDIRSTAALLLAALGVDGTTVVRGARHLDRGYERLDAKLAQIGAVVHRTGCNDDPGQSKTLSLEKVT